MDHNARIEPKEESMFKDLLHLLDLINDLEKRNRLTVDPQLLVSIIEQATLQYNHHHAIITKDNENDVNPDEVNEMKKRLRSVPNEDAPREGEE